MSYLVGDGAQVAAQEFCQHNLRHTPHIQVPPWRVYRDRDPHLQKCSTSHAFLQYHELNRVSQEDEAELDDWNERENEYWGFLHLVDRGQDPAKYGGSVVSLSDEWQTASLELLHLFDCMQDPAKYDGSVVSLSDEQQRQKEVYSVSPSLAHDTSLARYLHW